MRIHRLVGLLCVSFAAACASTNPIPAKEARSVAVFHAGNGARASWDELVGAAAGAEVVFVGENHGHPLGLASAAALFDDVLARSPNAALSLEFFERDEQSRLDDYLTGVADETTFEKRTDRRPGNFPPGHRAMIEAARNAHRPVHAANAPWQYTTLARKEGYERLAQLTPEQRRLFRIPDELATGRYRAAFHAQQLWDWTMADSITTALASGEAPVVHVVGHFHVDFEGGTAQALTRLRPGTRAVKITFITAWSDALRDEDKERADFVVYVGPSSE
jgi:uncharacterized iron-regulated protein